MAAEGVTIVTCWYNVREKENHQHKGDTEMKYFCTPDYYYSSMKGLLEQPLPLVLFTEPKYEAMMWEMRPSSLHHITRIVPLEYDELSFMNRFSLWDENHKNRTICNHEKNKFTSLYKFLVAHKTEFVKQAIHMNPFNTNIFAWMDLRLHPVYKIPM